MDLHKKLKDFFGISSFRSMQEETITSLLSRRDTFVVMPTGGGKSLCYQLPALLMPGTALVVSPLIALMKDQVDSLTKRRIASAAINSSQTYSQARTSIERAVRGEIKLLFV